ncbi:MAG TPA: hypothetical protein VFB60_22380 [Ktedonobacteraceae bacterium]|nr:hypothetical protein [Ktedonobacteraceae bacterium]
MMNQFSSIEKIDKGILYVLELASSVSVLLLAFGLIASMANVLTKGSVLSDNLTMQRIWAWTQCIAIDASVAGTIIRTFRYYAQGERVKYLLHGFLSLLLLFTAAIVSNIESVQQTLNITLEAAYVHVFVPVEALIWVRSLAIVLLIVAHALRHVQHVAPQSSELRDGLPRSQATLPTLSPELVEALRGVLAQVRVMEEVPQELLAPHSEQPPNGSEVEGEQEANNYERVKTFLVRSPGASARTIAQALGMSASTAHKWRGRVEGVCKMSE